MTLSTAIPCECNSAANRDVIFKLTRSAARALPGEPLSAGTSVHISPLGRVPHFRHAFIEPLIIA